MRNSAAMQDTLDLTIGTPNRTGSLRSGKFPVVAISINKFKESLKTLLLILIGMSEKFRLSMTRPTKPSRTKAKNLPTFNVEPLPDSKELMKRNPAQCKNKFQGLKSRGPVLSIVEVPVMSPSKDLATNPHKKQNQYKPMKPSLKKAKNLPTFNVETLPDSKDLMKHNPVQCEIKFQGFKGDEIPLWGCGGEPPRNISANSSL